MPIKVAIIEDQKELREMLAILINGSNGFECINQFSNAEEATHQIPNLIIDVILVDIHLPGQSGIWLVQMLKQKNKNLKFIMCSSLEDSEHIFNALKAGADGYITKSSPPIKILEAIQEAYNGGAPMSSQIARKVVSYFNPREHQESELSKLSAREKEILSYLAKGYRYKEIASFLFISTDTVRKHIHHIYEKLQVSSRTDAINRITGNPIF